MTGAEEVWIAAERPVPGDDLLKEDGLPDLCP